jgi:hypothetical protein
LIERVQRGDWDPKHHDDDRKSRDALAARGYWQAFQVVKASVTEIIAGANPGALVRTTHKDWYGEMFQPCVAVGLISTKALAGYRNDCGASPHLALRPATVASRSNCHSGAVRAART